MHGVVFAGGQLHLPAPRLQPDTVDVVIAVDSGWHHARQLGFLPDVLVGDFDSIDKDELEEAMTAEESVRIVRYSPDKDLTDLELGLQEAVAIGITELTVIAAWGDRMDHTLANVAVIADPRLRHITRRRMLVGNTTISVVDNDTLTLHGQAGDLVSLLPIGGPVGPVSSAGLRYPLDGRVLQPFAATGISNQLVDHTATVTARNGILLVIESGSSNSR